MLELATLALADVLAGTRVSWPANPWPWRLIVYSVPVIALALQRPLVRRVGFWNSLLAAWWFWTLLTLALAAYLPLASHLTLPATVAATLVIVVLAFAHRLDRPGFRCSAAILNALIAGVFMLPLAYMGEITQGFNAAPVMFVPLALVAVTLLPLLDRGRVKTARWIAVVVALVGIASAHWVSLYSELRPQRVNYTYVFDADANRATYLVWSPNPLPAQVATAAPFAEGQTPLPWELGEPPLLATADVIQRDATTPDPVSVSGTTRTLRLHPVADTSTIMLVLPKQTPIDAIRIDGLAVSTALSERGDYRGVAFEAPAQRDVTIEIDTTAADPIDAYLVDIAYRLPDGAKALVDARGSLAAPGGHLGDRWVVLRRVKI